MIPSRLCILLAALFALPLAAPPARADSVVIVNDPYGPYPPYGPHGPHFGPPRRPPPRIVVVEPAPPPVIVVQPAPAVVATPAPVAAAPQPYCREFQTQTIVGGQVQPSYGTACQQPDGSWKIISQKP